MSKGDRAPDIETPVAPVAPRIGVPKVDVAAAAEVTVMASKLGKEAALTIEDVDVRLSRYKEDHDTTNNPKLKSFP